MPEKEKEETLEQKLERLEKENAQLRNVCSQYAEALTEMTIIKDSLVLRTRMLMAPKQ